MRGLNYYPENPDWNDAAVLLSMMSNEQITKVIQLINSRGTAVLSEIKARKSAASVSLSPFAVLDSRFVPSEDMEMVALGMSTVLVNVIRKPKVGHDSYESILQNAFAIPDGMAAAAAKKIETEDVLGGTYTDADGKTLPWYESLGYKVVEGVRKIVNQVPETFGIPWEIDQNQSYDLDLLYEWRLLGEVVTDLNSRVRLMGAQAAINNNYGLFMTGDVEEGDVDYGDIEAGDTVRKLTLRSLPSSVFAGAPALGRFSEQSQKETAKKVADDIGLTGRPAKRPALKRAFARALEMKPSKAFLLGSMLGLTPAAIALIKSMRNAQATGDIEDGDAYSTISSSYGDNAAHNWLVGDVEGFLQEVGAIANDDCSTGDVNLDAAIESAEMAAGTGDVESLGPEIGGLFTRARINMAKRRAARATRKETRRVGRRTRKLRNTEQLQYWKDQTARNRNSYKDPQSQYTPLSNDFDNQEDYSSDVEPEDEGGFDMMEGTDN